MQGQPSHKENIMSNETSVLLVTAIAPGKEYVKSFLPRVIDSLGAQDVYIVDLHSNIGDLGVTHAVIEPNPNISDSENVLQRIAVTRKQIREYFLKGTWTHCLWLDCDIIAPHDSISRLMVLNAGIAAGVAPLRDFDPSTGNPYKEFVIPVLANNDVSPMMVNYIENVVSGIGFALVLTRRDVLEKTDFRDDLSLGSISEDFVFCLDSGEQVHIDPELVLWHVDEENRAGRLSFSPEKNGAVFVHTPQNVYIPGVGPFTRGIARTDLTQEQIDSLGPDFVKGNFRIASLEVKPVQEVIS